MRFIRFFVFSVLLGAVLALCPTPAFAGGAEFGVRIFTSAFTGDEFLPCSSADSTPDPGYLHFGFPPTFAVEKTSLSLVYTKLDCPAASCPSRSALTETFFDAVASSDLHALALLPVGPTGYDARVCLDDIGEPCEVRGDAPCDPTSGTTCGMERDALEVRKLARFTNPQIDRAVGMVSSDYFRAHGAPGRVAGTAIAETVFVDADVPAGSFPGRNDPTVPHELVHTYLLPDDRHVAPTRTTGYWPGCRAFGIPSCLVPSTAQNLMVDVASLQLNPPEIWIEDAVYGGMLSALSRGVDPLALDVSVLWKPDGTILIHSMIEFPEAKLSDEPFPGNHVIEVLDGSGSVLGALAMSLNFNRTWSGSDKLMFPRGLPIGAMLPYPTEAVAVRFREGDRILLVVDPLAMTLRETILRIPDRGYDRNPDERRKALLAKVDAFEQIVAKKKYRPALETLQNDIRDKVEKWVIDYDGPPQDLSKSKVLAQIDRTADRLRIRMAR